MNSPEKGNNFVPLSPLCRCSCDNIIVGHIKQTYTERYNYGIPSLIATQESFKRDTRLMY